MFVKRVYEQYLLDVDRGIRAQHRIVSLDSPPFPSIGVHPSDLGFCPLRAALKRLNRPPTHPPADAERASSLHLMRQGVQDAIPIQEALQAVCGAQIEAPIGGTINGIAVNGTLDALILGERAAVVEIKRRDRPSHANRLLPKRSDALQLYAYGQLIAQRFDPLPPPALHLLIANRYFVEEFQLDGLGVFDDGGTRVLRLDDGEFEAILQAHWDALSGLLRGRPPGSFVPAELRGSGHLNHENGWQCVRWEGGQPPKRYQRPYQGRTERLERAVPRCEYFCHPQTGLARQLSDTTFAYVEEASA